MTHPIADMLKEQNKHMPRGVKVTTWGVKDPRMFPYMEAIAARSRKPASRRINAIAWGIGAFCLTAIIAMGVPGAIASYQLSTL